jgi:HPt (histidine-containing phosphotransfer) domain-containing protein
MPSESSRGEMSSTESTSSDSVCGSTALDLPDALRRVEGDRTMLREILEIFFEDLPPSIERLRSTVLAEQWEDARREAHSMKGTAANMGATELSSDSKELESSIKTRDFTLVPAQLAKVEQSVRLVLEARDGVLRQLRD